MFKVLILLASLVLATAYESSTYNLYFNDTTYLDSFRGGDYYFQVERRFQSIDIFLNFFLILALLKKFFGVPQNF